MRSHVTDRADQVVAAPSSSPIPEEAGPLVGSGFHCISSQLHHRLFIVLLVK